MLQQLIVTSREDGWRLDACVAEKAPPWVSRSNVQRNIKEGKVFVNGCNKKSSFKVRNGDLITFDFPEKPKETAVEPEDLPLKIIFEDRDVIVVNKDPGMIVHPVPRKQSGTLVNALLNHCSDLQGIGGVVRPGIVHRLDKDTSGILVVAKNEMAHNSLTSQFKERLTSKEYIAIVKGRTPETGEIDIPIARHKTNRLKMTVDDEGKKSLTRYIVLCHFGDVASLILVKPRTGRTHQIRVHMKSTGHPLLGDHLYGKANEDRVYGVERQMLHALRLSFYHPRSGERVTFQAPLPEDIKAAIKNLSSFGCDAK